MTVIVTPHHYSRPELYRWSLVASLAASAMTAVVVALSFLWPLDAETRPTATIEASRLPGVSGAPVAFALGNERGYLLRVAYEDSAAGFVALDRGNPSGCTVSWRSDSFVVNGERFEGVYRDPCRGTVFDRSGHHVFGPGSDDLARFLVERRPDGDIRVSLPPSPLSSAR